MYLYSQHEPADFITLCDMLERTGSLENVGGPSYISSLLNEVPTSGHIAHYGHIVERTSILRQLIHAAGQIAALAYEQGVEAQDALRRAEEIVFRVGKRAQQASFAPMQHIMVEYVERLSTIHEALRQHRSVITGVPTGYGVLDSLTGGLQPTDLIILAGRPGIGKTALATCIAYHAALKGRKKCAVFSLEMSQGQLGARLLAMVTGIDTQRQRAGWIGEDEWETVIAACGKIGQLPIWVNDTAGNPILSMRSQLRRLIAETGGIDLVLVDYLQLVEPEEGESRKHFENRTQEVGKIARGLKALAREFEVPVLALAQLSREVEHRKPPRPLLSDLKESGDIEAAADMVLLLYREDYYARMEKREHYTPTNLAELTIAKYRNGPVGEVALYFQDERTMFYNVEDVTHVE
jgi:replicative DNA helicase